TAHKTTHQDAGSDEISILDLSGEAADVQKSAWTKISGKPTTFTPSLHASSHQNGGSDEISVAGLTGLLAYEQNAGAIKGIPVPTPAAVDDEKAITYDHDTLAFKYLAGGAAAHAITHQDGGIDELDVTDLSGVLADQQPSEFSIVSGLLAKFQGLITGNWTIRTSAADNNWLSVCWSPELSLFCAV
ncbi:unnamed protein product, partial [marine sediment metagenome]